MALGGPLLGICGLVGDCGASFSQAAAVGVNPPPPELRAGQTQTVEQMFYTPSPRNGRIARRIRSPPLPW